MAQSLNTKADYSTEGIAYLGFAEYGKILIGDVAFEFYNDRNVEKNMTFPWTAVARVEGDVSKSFYKMALRFDSHRKTQELF